MFTGFAIAADFEFGFARRLMLAAPNRGGIVIGYMITAMVRALFVLVRGVRRGAHQRDAGPGSFAGPARAARARARRERAVDAVGGGIAMRMRTMQAGPVMQMPIFILLFLAPVYVPLPLDRRLGARRRALQPGHRDARGGARLHRRRADEGR